MEYINHLSGYTIRKIAFFIIKIINITIKESNYNIPTTQTECYRHVFMHDEIIDIKSFNEKHVFCYLSLKEFERTLMENVSECAGTRSLLNWNRKSPQNHL